MSNPGRILRWTSRQPRCGSGRQRVATGASVGVLLLLTAWNASGHGDNPEARQILVPPDRPEEIILATNFGIISSVDSGETWLWSCEQDFFTYGARNYQLARDPKRILTLSPFAGLLYSDDDACTWTIASSTFDRLDSRAMARSFGDLNRLLMIGVTADEDGYHYAVYSSDDDGNSIGSPVFEAKQDVNLEAIMFAPSDPDVAYLTLSVNENFESTTWLASSKDGGMTWSDPVSLADTFGTRFVQLWAVDNTDPNKLYMNARLRDSDNLVVSPDGGKTFDTLYVNSFESFSFVQLRSGTLVLAGANGLVPFALRSEDGGASFEELAAPPHLTGFAERDGKVYATTDQALDGFSLAVSEDDGVTFKKLFSFRDLSGIKTCVQDLCAAQCVDNALLSIWPLEVCDVPLPDAGAPLTPPEDGGLALPDSTTGETPGDAGISTPDAGRGPGAADSGMTGPGADAASDDGDASDGVEPNPVDDGCGCRVPGGSGERSLPVVFAALLGLAAWRRRHAA